MNESLKEVPSLDTLVSDPNQVFQLAPETARGLLGGLIGLLPALVAQSSRDTNKAEVPAIEKWLTVEQAAEIFNVKPRWLRENKDKLPHSKPSRKVLLFEETKLRKWFVAHKAH